MKVMGCYEISNGFFDQETDGQGANPDFFEVFGGDEW